MKARAPLVMKLAAIAIFMIGGLALLIRTTMSSGSFSYPLLYPQVMLISVLVLFAILLVQTLREPSVHPANGAEEKAPSSFTGSFAPALGLVTCAAYLALWNTIGHLASTVLFMLAMLTIGQERNIWLLLGLSLVFPVIIWFVFDQFLRIPLPTPAW